jgi:hypothetical protein
VEVAAGNDDGERERDSCCSVVRGRQAQVSARAREEVRREPGEEHLGGDYGGDSCSPVVGPQRPRYRSCDGVVSRSMPVKCTKKKAKTFDEALEHEAFDSEKVLY